MTRFYICYTVVLVSFFDGVRAGITTSDGFWTHQSKLSTAAAGLDWEASFKKSSISAKSVRQWNLTSDCSTASIHGTLTIQNPCRHIPEIAGSSQSTRSTQSTTNTNLSNQATITDGVTNTSGEVIDRVTAESFATAQNSPSATTLTPLLSTQSRPSILHVVSITSLNQHTESSSTVSFAESLSTNALGHGVSDRVNGTILATKTTFSLAIPTSATSSRSMTTAGTANATLSNATQTADTKELQNQLLAVVALTRTWVNKSTESNSHNAVNAINGTILFAQVCTISKLEDTTYIKVIKMTRNVGPSYPITRSFKPRFFMF